MPTNLLESLNEMSKFMNPWALKHLKTTALHNVFSVTGNAEAREVILTVPHMLIQFIFLMQDNCETIAKNAASALINMTADEPGIYNLLIIAESKRTEFRITQDKIIDHNLVQLCLRYILDKDNPLADHSCMILSNMTRSMQYIDRMIKLFESSGCTWDSILSAFTANQYNKTGANLHYLAPVLCNLSQSAHMRKYFMDKDRCVIQRLLPFTEYADSPIRRRGIIGTLKNCCFEIDKHEWLLSQEIDILSYLLLPLAGSEEFDEEDTEKLPINLQYLPETKTREPLADIRVLLLEALEQLCATRNGRQILRDKNTYIILREYHKWEKDKIALLACENVVDILIRTEEEIGFNNLKELQVPDEYKEKFFQMDEDYIKDA